MNRPTKIGVFDSGVGGLSVARAIEKAFPDCEVLLREDRDNLPYGTKTPEQLFTLVRPILEDMAQAGCEVIVIACNTVSTNCIEELRAVIHVPLIATEPMIKPAAEATKTGVIGVFATPATLRSKRYAWLVETYAQGKKIVEPDCSQWALMIEENRVNLDEVERGVQEALSAGVDVLVLGCTHYHWIDGLIMRLAGKDVLVIQPERALLSRLATMLEQQL